MMNMNMNMTTLSLLVRLGWYYFCCSAKISWDYILKPTIAVLSTNVIGQVFVCFILYLFVYACTVIITNCIKTTIKASINAIQCLIDDMGGSAFNAILFIIIMIIGGPFFLVYDAACQIHNFFFIEEDHLKIISVYMTVLQLVTCPLWNITRFLIKTMMTAYVYIATATGGSSIPDLTPATPERRSDAPASEYSPPKFYRRNAYTEEPTLPVVVVNDFYRDLDKFVAYTVEKKPKVPAPAFTAPALAPTTTPVPSTAPAQEPAYCDLDKVVAYTVEKKPEVPAPAFTAPAPTTTTTVPSTAPAQEPTAPPTAPTAPPRTRKATIVRRTFVVGPITAIENTVQLSSKAFRRPFIKETSSPPASSVPCHEQQQQQQQETIIVETVADGDYTYMSPSKNIDEAQKQIDLFDHFQDKEAIWNYIESAWEDDRL